MVEAEQRQSRIRILIVDDHAIVREGLRALIGTQPDMELVGEAANGDEAVERAFALRPDVVLMDLVMPRKDGIAAINEIVAAKLEARILVLTSFAGDEKVLPAIKAGALGYLLKDSSPQDLLRGIREVHRNQASLHPTIARRLIRELAPAQAPVAEGEALTDREREVLALVAHGLSNQEIADKLVISERTVRTHVGHILAKLHLARRTQAVLYAVRQGLGDNEAGQ